MNISNVWIWAGFLVFVVIALSIDTFLLDKKHARAHESARAALAWTIIWIISALIFNLILWLYLNYTADASIAKEKALMFLTGYLIEKTLSLDNLFAFYIIFHQLHIPVTHQQRVFSYGIWSAIIMRLVLILLGTWLVQKFHWILYLMGVFLLWTGFKIFLVAEKEKILANSPMIKFVRRFVPVTTDLHGHHFFIRENNVLTATPLFIALIFVEMSDLIFAFDSIPAIFAITTDPFIVWSSNVFAILGLRALYFLLANMVQRFRLLKYGLGLILIFIGSKMLIAPWIKISTVFSLGTVGVILVLFVCISLLERK